MWVSVRCDILPPLCCDVTEKHKRIHTPLPVTLHIINITKDYKNYNISALHAAASDTRIRDRLMCAQPGQAVLLS